MRNEIILYYIFMTVLFISCNNDTPQKYSNQTISNLNDNKQFNITILLDLSDRLVKNLNPTPIERDKEIIRSIIKIFKDEMNKKGSFLSKGKIKVLFDPIPQNNEISNIARELNIDLSELDSKQKKIIYDSIDSLFISNLSRIYLSTLDSKKWIGSDIWRFFKNDVVDLCIEDNPSYRNILIIISDGYIYHKQSIERIRNRTSFITSSLLNQEGLRNNPNWKEKFEKEDYGIISTRNDLENLEVLFLEVNSPDDNKMDEDIIKTYLNKWFSEMKVKKLAIFNTDLPINTSKKIENFFNSY